MVTLTEAAVLIYDVLNNDATLRGATLLNGANRIQNHPLRPAMANNPRLTIEARSNGKGERGTANFFIRLRLYLDNFGEITADVARADLIQERIYVLLHEKQFTSSDNVACRQCVSDNESGPHQDAEYPNESVWFYDYNMIGVEKT